MGTLRRLVLACALPVSLSAHAGELDLTVSFEGSAPSADLEYRVRGVLGRMHAWYDDVLGLDLPEVLPLRVRLISSRETYEGLAAQVGVGHSTLGFFSLRTGGVVWRNPDEDELLRTLVHEASHFLANAGGASLPTWADEGLAEVFESFRIQGNAIWLEPDRNVLAWLRAGAGARVSADQLVAAGEADWVRLGNAPNAVGPGGSKYGYGWSLACFLFGSEPGRRTLAAVARVPGGRRDPEAVRAAVQGTWPGGLTALDAQWRAWWRGSPSAQQLPVRSATTVPAAPASACEGGILIRRGGTLTCER